MCVCVLYYLNGVRRANNIYLFLIVKNKNRRTSRAVFVFIGPNQYRHRRGGVPGTWSLRGRPERLVLSVRRAKKKLLKKQKTTFL